MTVLARLASSTVLAPKPSTLAWRDREVSKRRRVRSLLWFLTGGWRSASLRLALRTGLQQVDRILGGRGPGVSHPD